MKRLVATCLLLFCSSLFSKEVLILTPVFNKPEFIGWQKQLFDKFVLDEDIYRFVAFDDSIDDLITKQMVAECKKWDVEYRRIPQEIHSRPYLPRDPWWPVQSASHRVSHALQYIMDTMGFDHEGIVFLTESDQFLMRPFHFHKETADCDIYTALVEAAPGIRYLRSGITIFRMDRLPDKRSMNFNNGRINGAVVDSAGFTYYYFKNHPEVRVKQTPVLCASTLFLHNRFAKRQNTDVPVDEQIKKLKKYGFNEMEIAFLQRKTPDLSYAYNNAFLHYNAGSNYDNQSQNYISQKDALLRTFIQEKLNS